MTLRSATAADDALLRRVYASTRADELAAVPWPDDVKAAFVDQQFDAQASHYRAHYPGLEELVVVVDGDDAGRLYVQRSPADIRILDIALLPQWRNRGIGTGLLEDLMSEAAASDSIVSLHVESTNPARRLYDRLGFAEVEHGPVYDRLEWRPTPTTPPPRNHKERAP